MLFLKSFVRFYKGNESKSTNCKPDADCKLCVAKYLFVLRDAASLNIVEAAFRITTFMFFVQCNLYEFNKKLEHCEYHLHGKVVVRAFTSQLLDLGSLPLP